MNTDHTTDDNLFNSFVGTEVAEYIICECGDNFASEAALNAHLEKDHDETKTLPKVIVQKQNHLDDDVPNVEYSETVDESFLDGPLYLITESEVKEEPTYEYYTVESKGDTESPIKSEDDVNNFEEDVNNSEEDVNNFEDVNNSEEDVNNSEEDVNNSEADVNNFEEDVNDFEEDDHVEDIKEEIIVSEPAHDAEDSAAISINDNLKLEYDYEKLKGFFEVFCEQCGKSFSSVRARNSHVIYVHEAASPRARRRKMPKVAVCEHCGSSYASHAALRYHLRSHTNERPYNCPMCPKRFTMPLYVQVHIRTHTGERPFQCPLCPKAFNNKAALLRHDRVHTGEKPYACGECGKAFSQSNSVKLHIRTVHRRLPALYKSKARKLKALQRAEARAVMNAENRDADNSTDFATRKKQPIILRIVNSVKH